MALRAAGAKADTADRVVAQAKATKTGPVIMMISNKSQKSVGKKGGAFVLVRYEGMDGCRESPFF